MVGTLSKLGLGRRKWTRIVWVLVVLVAVSTFIVKRHNGSDMDKVYRQRLRRQMESHPWENRAQDGVRWSEDDTVDHVVRKRTDVHREGVNAGDATLNLEPINQIHSRLLHEQIESKPQSNFNVNQNHAFPVDSELHTESSVKVSNNQETRHEDGKSDGRVLWRSSLPDILPGADDSNLHGIVGLRPDGTQAWTPEQWQDHPETMEEKREHHKQNCFNLARSDSIGLNREIPDVRASECKDLFEKLPADLPDTSVVFVFFNEPLSPLFRSIHSVLNRTPPHLLKEIIIVDDGSDAEWTQQPLLEYLATLPKVVLLRMPFRQGLMATREEGAKLATARTVTFLDSHIECNVGWLEPMLARIKKDRKHVVMPIIDSIDPDNFRYRAGGLDILAFSWSLGQKGIARRRERFKPMESPVMAGGLFSIDRTLFFELGGYDPEMKLYGGEEMEISLRLWECGNTLECIPCSRVGHVFRTGKYWQGQVYPVPGHVIIKNKLRASYMWLDEYAKIAHNVMGNLPKGKEIGDLSWGHKIKQKCLDGGPSHNFSWYLKNVYPELTDVLGLARYTGDIMNPETHGCIDTLGNHQGGGNIGAYPCHGSHGTQEFMFGHDGQIRIALADFTTCIRSREGDNRVFTYHCNSKANPAEGFNYDPESGLLKEKRSNMCLACMHEKSPQSPLALKFRTCSAADKEQIWKFKNNIASH